MVAFAGYPLLVDDKVIGVVAMFARNALTEETLNDLAVVADCSRKRSCGSKQSKPCIKVSNDFGQPSKV